MATCAPPPTSVAGPPRRKWSTRSARPSADAGYELVRAHPFKPRTRHGFIGSQKEGMSVFAGIDPERPLIVAEAVWQYSHHVLPGLISHKGPILTVANWSGTWPGLVGMLNLNGSLTKAGVKYSTLWSEDFTDEFFVDGLRRWLDKGEVKHTTDHVTPLQKVKVPTAERKLGAGAGRTAAPREGHHGHLRRRLHGHVQRHHPRRAAQSDRACTRSGSASRPCTTRPRRSATTRPAAVRQLDGRPRHEVRHRSESRRAT